MNLVDKELSRYIRASLNDITPAWVLCKVKLDDHI